MKYYETIKLKDGRECVIRSAAAEDAEAALDNFILTHSETDFLMSYPDEITHTVESETKFLRDRAESADEVEIAAFVDGRLVGLAGIDRVGAHEKVRHRANFGISVEKAYWGLGIGRAMLKACIECARKAGYAQLELDVAAANRTAVALYESEGFAEYGRNPKGFRSRESGWQELVLMRLDFGE